MIDLEAERYVEQAKRLTVAIRRLRSEHGVQASARPAALICGPRLPEQMYADICALAKLAELRHV